MENISAEIPGRKAIAHENASYYPALATAVLGADAWGLVAARLGKRVNRTQFVNAFRFTDPDTGVRGFKDILAAHERAPLTDWRGAVAEFRAALRAETVLRTERRVGHPPVTELDSARELSGAWTDPEWNKVRTELFLAALALHQRFAEAEPKRMRQSLHAAMDVLTGSVSAQRLADEVNRFGTYLPGDDDDDVWPARRCARTGAASSRCSASATRSRTAD